MSTAPNGDPQGRIARRPSRRWLWFFGVLVLLTVTAIAVETWYNLRQQLRPDQLAAARQLWREKAPASYQVQYTLKRQDGSERRWTASVREGELIAVTGGSGQSLARGDYLFDRMDAMFDYVERQLQADAEPGAPRVFATAVFDRNDGHILRYIRSTRSPRERIEVTVELRPLS
jgi:hypothetical protein